MQKVCKRSKSATFSPDRGSTLKISGEQDPLQQNYTETLPTEMSVRIFSELDVRSLCQASLTCRHWNDIIEGSDQLWRSHCLTVLAVCRREVDGDRLDGCSWKVTLVRNYRKGCVKRRWLKGRYSNIRSADDIPPNSMCPLDVETWGEILEAELDR
ncbi:F-box only protein 48-like [Carassius carassius]|uniref:F-box only protein 48-like n=1 Tax=Carassius carassius TaxID=217509 RepID=UPI00286868ED|nr:F-box only protein 48-like [Carassius carassius]